MQAETDGAFPDVVTEIEVVRINPNRGQGLVVSTVAEGEVRRLPTTRLRPDEDPSNAVSRVLRDVVGVSTVHHEPHFLGYRRYGERQQPQSTLSLSFLVLGPIPDNSQSTTKFVPVHRLIGGRRRSRLLIDHPDTVIDALNAAVTLLETTTIALKLLGEKVTVFTLQQLLDVYRSILGDDVSIDLSNFRRKVEAAHDFVRPAEPPELPAGRGRPPRWYTAGEATLLDPPIRFRRSV